MKELMRQYFMGELDAISLIRMLSGMFNPKNATSLLTLICTITRHEQGDIDTETFNEVWKFGIDLKFNNGDYPSEYDNKTIDELKEELVKMTAEHEDLAKDIKENGPTVAEEGIDNATGLVGLDHDISLLTTYLTYRMRKEERENGKMERWKKIEIRNQKIREFIKEDCGEDFNVRAEIMIEIADWCGYEWDDGHDTEKLKEFSEIIFNVIHKHAPYSI